MEIKNLKYSIGIDMSKDKFDACLSVIDTTQRVIVKSTSQFNNTKAGFRDLVTWSKKHTKEEIPLVICMEATGIYHENCAYYLFNEKFSVSIILPNKAKKYLESLGLKSKNDKIDAKGLSQMGAEKKLDTWKPLGLFFYILRMLTRQHQNVVETACGMRNQLSSLKYAMHQSKTVLKQLQKSIDLLDQQKKETLKEIILHLKTDKKLYKKFNTIKKINGIGVISLATILAETNGFELFKNAKQLISYSGLDIVEDQSGKRAGKTKISKKGNSRIRRILYMPSLCVVKYKYRPFIDLYNRIVEKTGIKMKGCVAIQKKMLVLVYTLWKNEEDYDPDYSKKSSIDNTEDATQDDTLNDNLPKPQNYKKSNEKPKQSTKKIPSNSKNIKQPRGNSKVPEVQV